MPDVTPEAIAEASLAFSKMVQQRHNDGAQKYGAIAFLAADTIEMALEELADLMNYARYTAIKLILLQKQIDEATVKNPSTPMLGVDSIVNPYGG